MDTPKAAAALALSAMLLAACGGGGDDAAKVEASLRQYISTLTPETAPFLIGAGPPRVRENSCKKLPKPEFSGIRIQTGAAHRFLRFPKQAAFWSCVVTVGEHYKVGETVVLNSSGKVFLLVPRQRTERPLSPAAVYEGGPKQPKP